MKNLKKAITKSIIQLVFIFCSGCLLGQGAKSLLNIIDSGICKIIVTVGLVIIAYMNLNIWAQIVCDATIEIGNAYSEKKQISSVTEK